MRSARLRPTVLIFALVILSGEAQTARAVETGQTVQLPDAVEYVLLDKTGAHWTYQVTWEIQTGLLVKKTRREVGTLIIVNEGGAVFEGKAAARILWTYLGGLSYQMRLYLTASPEAVWLIGSEITKGSRVSRFRYDPPVPFLKNPVTLGGSWNYDGRMVDESGGTKAYGVSDTVEQEDYVGVPAGRFNAMKIVGKQADGAVSQEWWARGVGLVKREEVTGAYRSVAQLVQFSLPGEAAKAVAGVGPREMERPAVPQLAAPLRPSGTPERLSYAGYSKQFVPIKERLLRGERDGIVGLYAETEKQLRESCEEKRDCVLGKMGFLGFVEKGTLALDMGRPDDVIGSFENAELVMQAAENQSKAAEWVKKGFSFLLETVTGYEEIGAYYGEGFERVLFLNYKTIAYMLQGERRAYNVTRRAIDWQNMEKRKFEDRLQETQKELNEKDPKSEYVTQVQEAYRETDAKASLVASAYVNPFGYYMAGVIQEFESKKDPSLRSNAAISYKKALELNPNSPVIQEIVRELEDQRETPPGSKLIHVIVNDGFVPEKMMLTHYIRTTSAQVPVKLPYYRPVPNKVQRIAIEEAAGERQLATLSPVADVEAIVLRHQKDLQPFLTVRFVLATVRSAFAEGLRQQGGIFGRLLGGVMQQVAAPDTRAWMTLPSTVRAARLFVPKDLDRIAIATYDERGERLTSQVVSLHADGATFVYGRSIDDTLIVHASKDLWVNDTWRREVTAK